MASYLPLLLSSVSGQHVPSDDSSLSTQARGQVDYLSHEWNEDDIARSWRNMTRQKNEIANGPRLENASWRTWWKQRNKLKTISPETLNWLKDSDVTWLYGPLHTALDWSPPPKPAEDITSVEKEHNAHDRLGLSWDPHGPKKPILKHRTISELLVSALPASHEDAEYYDGTDGFIEDLHAGNTGPTTRPPLIQTKSDTNVLKLARPHNPLRKDSPPRIIAEPHSPTTATLLEPQHHPEDLPRSGSSDSATGSSQDLNATSKSAKRHITFNTYVEQCIAIDSPTKQPKKPSPDTRWAQYEEEEDDGYDEDSETGFNDLDDGSAMFSDHDSDDDDESQLEISTPSSRSRSSSSSQIYIHQPPPYPHHRVTAPTFKSRPKLKRTHSSDKEHITIAPIAPTMLKTTGVGNYVYGLELGEQSNLVYVPTSASNSQLSLGKFSGGSDEGVYRHPGSRFSYGPPRGLHGSSSSSSSSRSPNPDRIDVVEIVPSAEALPPPVPYSSLVTPPSPGASLFLKPSASSDITPHNPYSEHPDEEAVNDYFGAAARSGGFGRSGHEDMGVDVDVQEVETYQPPPVIDEPMPEVVLQDEHGTRFRGRSRSRSRSKSHSRTPSPALVDATTSTQNQTSSSSNVTAPVAIPLPRRTISHESALLSPPSPERERGRSGPSSSSPALHSRSLSSSVDGERERGRAPSRGAMSDRERSESRSLPGSPLGSVSPTGSVIGLQYAASSAFAANGRKRPREGDGGGSGVERGRSSGRRSASTSTTSESSQSLSPTARQMERRLSLDGVVSSASGRDEAESGNGRAKMVVAIPDPIAEEDGEEGKVASSSSSGSTPTVTPTNGVGFLPYSTLVGPPPPASETAVASSVVTPSAPAVTPSPSVTAPSPPAAASSPAAAPSPAIAAPSPAAVAPSPAIAIATPLTNGFASSSSSKSKLVAVSPPSSPTLKTVQDQAGSLVGRAVSSAKGLLGSIW